MIESLSVKNVATYDSTGIEMNLSKINYIFGSNGTGKTTISEFLRKKENYPNCKIEWNDDGANYDVFVYNRNFVRENFSMRNEIKGIFTLGKESTDLVKQIELKLQDIEKHDEKIKSIKGRIEEVKNNLSEIKNNFMSRCWNLKQKYDEHFKEAFTGVRNNRENFMNKCIEEANNNTSVLNSLDELKNRIETVFKGTQVKYELIQPLQYNYSCETAPIFEKNIIGELIS